VSVYVENLRSIQAIHTGTIESECSRGFYSQTVYNMHSLKF